MEDKNDRRQEGQSLIVVALMLLLLFLFAVIAVDLAYGYVHRRSDQNAADAAALAGARELAGVLNENNGDLSGLWIPETDIQAAMNKFAEENGVQDTGGSPGDAVNTNVSGYYLGADGSRLSDQSGFIEIGELGIVPQDARGVEAIAHSVAPSFFGGIVGLDGLPIQAEAAVVFNGEVCSMDCIAPIATYTMSFQTDDNGDGFPCYNIWDGTRQQNEGGNCPDWGRCSGGVCTLNPNISCSIDVDCGAVCPGGGVCSLPLDGSQTCDNQGDCTVDYGNCVSGRCHYNSSIACDGHEDCEAVCTATGWVCSGSGDPCSADEDCAEGEWCEDGVSSGSASGLGWLNWSLQGPAHSCETIGPGVGSDCSASCLGYNLKPNTCLSGEIMVSGPDGDTWVAGAAGVKNTSFIKYLLDCYADRTGHSEDCPDPGQPITVVVYDESRGRGCSHQGVVGAGHLEYRVVGFAEFKVLGYQLSNGTWYWHDGAGCEDWGAEGNRITGTFIRWVDGSPGECDTTGTIVAPCVVK